MATTPQLLPTPASPDVRRWLPLIVGLAVGIRFALGWVHPFKFPDWEDYNNLARAIANHQPYETHGNIATRMPGYPVFVALIYALGGAERAIVVVQALMGGGVVLITYLLGRRIQPTVGLLAAALLAIDPLAIGFSAALLTEAPFTFVFMLSLWLCVRITERPRFARATVLQWLALGILWALAVYLRAAALWAIVPLVAWLAWTTRRTLPPMFRVLFPALTLATVFALLTPWLVRNYRHFHSGPLRLTTLEGISLYEAVYPEADGGPKQDVLLKSLPPEMQTLDEAQRNDEWSRRGWQFVRSDPLRIAKLALIKFGRTWSPWLNAAEFRAGPILWALTLWYSFLFAAGITELARRWPSDRARLWFLFLIPVVYFTALHALFLGSVRYRVPLTPLVCLFAAAGFISVAGGIIRWGFRQRLVR